MKKEIAKLLSVSGLEKKEILSLIEVPKNSEMGDYAFPCFSLAKKFKKSPDKIAEEIVSKIKKTKDFEKIGSVSGYVNFFVDRAALAVEVVKEVESKKEKYGSGNYGNKKIMIEFSQANTHKAFHVGHVRGTSLGESLARINEFCGNKVIRANYQGDAGMHVAKWLWCYEKYHYGKEIRNEEDIAKIYVDAVGKTEKSKKFLREAEEINRKLESKEDKKLNELWRKTRKLSLNAFEKIYHELNTKFDVYFFESEMEKKGKEISNFLVDGKIAEVSEKAVIVDLEKCGLDVIVLLRKDGTVLYSAKDLALAKKKFKEYKIDGSFYVIGKAQDLYIHQIFKILELMDFKNSKNNFYVPFNEVRFPWGKMSSRTGENVLYSDFKKNLVKEAVNEIDKRYELDSVELYDRALAISIAALKYWMLKHDGNKVIIFNPKEALRFDGDTGPYLLYSYARAGSILDKAKYKKAKKFGVKKISDYEKRVVLELSKFPEVVKQSYKKSQPNLIANYSYNLAKTFNEFYHNIPVIGSEEEQFRLKLVDVFSQVIKNSLYLLGINTIRKM